VGVWWCLVGGVVDDGMTLRHPQGLVKGVAGVLTEVGERVPVSLCQPVRGVRACVCVHLHIGLKSM
jgi:hypothetical protein